MVGRIDITVESLFRRPALASSVSPIIKKENIHPQLMKKGRFFQAVADILGIAMAKKNRVLAAFGRDKPPMEHLMICGFEGNIFKLKAICRRIIPEGLFRKIDGMKFKKP